MQDELMLGLFPIVRSVIVELKLWMDDIRRPPDDTWVWARTNQQAKEIFRTGHVVECSLDHDLGLHNHDPDVPDADLQQGMDPVNDGYKLVQWMISTRHVPKKVTIHSWNYDGARRMALSLLENGHKPIVKPYER